MADQCSAVLVLHRLELVEVRNSDACFVTPVA